MKKFLRVYYKWVHDAKGLYTKITTEKDVKKLVDGYEKFTGNDVKVQKTPGSPSTNICKIELKDPTDIDKYRSLSGHLIWYTVNVGPDVVNAERELAVHVRHPGT